MFETADQLGLGQNAALDSLFQLGFGRPRFEAGILIQGVQLEKVMVDRAVWRSWPAVSDLAVIVFSLA
jgi:hypothetical protein